LEDTGREPAEAGSSNSHLAYEDDDQIALVTIEEDFDPSVTFSSLPPPSDLLSPSGDQKPLLGTQKIATDGEEGQDKGDGERKSAVPVSGRRAQSKLAKERDRVKMRKKVDKERSRSMETKAERKKGRQMEAKRRVKKASIAMDREGGRRRSKR